ncbi:MAG: histidine kinase dimerization/phosphoacceptor domain -containing protein [Pseudomonadota bacterium]
MASRSPPENVHNLALALVAASAAPLLLLDDDLIVIAASASFCSLFHIDPATAPGSRLGALGGGEWNLPQLAALLKATGSGFAEIDGYEMDLKRDGKETRRLVLNARKLDYAGGGDIRLVLSITDITQARAAERLQENLLREKDVLLQELHHRVANSLQIIASVLMQSARKVVSEETRSHLYDAHQRVMSVAALQHQLAVSRLGDVEMRPYLAALCESISASMIRDREQVGLEARSDESINTADASVCLGLIVTELVINALKHAFPGNRNGKILVDYRGRGPNWSLSVSDDGVGMPADPESAKPGLGTSIVQALATQMGAQITVTSANPGTSVCIAHHFVPVLVDQDVGMTALGRAV